MIYLLESKIPVPYTVKLAEIVKLTCRELGIPINEKKTPNY